MGIVRRGLDIVCSSIHADHMAPHSPNRADRYHYRGADSTSAWRLTAPLSAPTLGKVPVEREGVAIE